MADASILSALSISLQPANLLACFLGVLLGTLVGVLPGLGPAAAMALALPLTIRLGPTAGLIMLAGIYYGSMYGGSTTSILVNVPGEPASVVTAIDGYRMARRGRAGAALAVAAMGSFVAGTIGVIGLQLFAPLLANAALAFGPAEYFALTLLGVVLLSHLSGTSRTKSLATVGIGLMLSTVGIDSLGGVARFSFGYPPAQAGVSFIAIAAGAFGVAEVLSLMARRERPAEGLAVRFRELYPSREELQRSWPPILRGSVLGFLVGLLPGPVATLASFASYGLERRVSRHREELGKGAIEGVAGPEAANNAACAGGMVPLLSLGLAFTPATAVLLSGMLLLGVTPGPFLLRQNPEVFWGVVGSLYLGNAMLLVLNLPLVGIFARVARIQPAYLMPAVLALCVVGAYADNNNLFDVWVMAAAGAIGYVMRRYEYHPAPLVLGLVLGPIMERSLLQALIISQGDIRGLWESSVSTGLLLAAVLAAMAPLLHALYARRRSRLPEVALRPQPRNSGGGGTGA